MKIRKNLLHLIILCSSSLYAAGSQAICGRSDQTRYLQGLVSNGRNAPCGKWPWMSSLRHNRIHRCGAVAIGNNFVLTAAHCFDKFGRNEKEWSIRIGACDLSRRSTTLGEEVQLEKIFIHPNYVTQDPIRPFDDIALIKFTSRNKRTPICLPSVEALKNYDGRSSVVTGWGFRRATGPSTAILQEGDVPILRIPRCRLLLKLHQGKRSLREMNQNFVCAGDIRKNVNACQGDSGGPLVIRTRRNRWVVLGVVSFGLPCGPEPVAFVRVSRYRDWIRSITKLSV